MPPPPLKVCVIGMGPIGNRHARVYREDALAQLVGVCDIKKDRADSAASRLSAPAFYDTQAMLDAWISEEPLTYKMLPNSLRTVLLA